MRAACKALTQIRDPRGLWPLIASLSHPDKRRRYNALRPLWALADVRALLPIGKLLQDPEPRLRMEAAEAIVKMGHLGGVPLLSRALQADHPPHVSDAIKASVIRLRALHAPTAAQASARTATSAGHRLITAWRALGDEERHMWNRYRGGFKAFSVSYRDPSAMLSTLAECG